MKNRLSPIYSSEHLQRPLRSVTYQGINWVHPQNHSGLIAERCKTSLWVLTRRILTFISLWLVKYFQYFCEIINIWSHKSHWIHFGTQKQTTGYRAELTIPNPKQLLFHLGFRHFLPTINVNQRISSLPTMQCQQSNRFWPYNNRYTVPIHLNLDHLGTCHQRATTYINFEHTVNNKMNHWYKPFW